MPKTRKTPRSKALYREVIPASRGHRTVRIAAYPPIEDQETGVTLGIGYADPESFAKIYFEVTGELWTEINKHVRKALAAANQHIAEEAARSVGVEPNQPPPKPKPGRPPTGTRKRKSPAERRAMQQSTDQPQEGSP